MNVVKKVAAYLILLFASSWLVTFLALRFENHEYAQLSDAQLSAAAAYLDGKLTPTPPEWQWTTFTPEPDVTQTDASALARAA